MLSPVDFKNQTKVSIIILFCEYILHKYKPFALLLHVFIHAGGMGDIITLGQGVGTVLHHLHLGGRFAGFPLRCSLQGGGPEVLRQVQQGSLLCSSLLLQVMLLFTFYVQVQKG